MIRSLSGMTEPPRCPSSRSVATNLEYERWASGKSLFDGGGLSFCPAPNCLTTDTDFSGDVADTFPLTGQFLDAFYSTEADVRPASHFEGRNGSLTELKTLSSLTLISSVVACNFTQRGLAYTRSNSS